MSPNPIRKLSLFALVSCLGSAPLWGCTPDLKTKGSFDRVIGEVVTLALLEGGDPFSGEITLVDASSRKFTGPQLSPTLTTDRELSFTIPVGTSAGRATIWVTQKDSQDTYSLDLQINRLVVRLRADGIIDIAAVAPATLGPNTIAAPLHASGTAARQLAVTSGGSLLVSLVGESLRMHSLQAAPKELISLASPNAQYLAPLPKGAVVATSDSIQVYRHSGGSTVENGGQLALGPQVVKGLAVSEDGTTAAILTTCTVNGETGDCLTRANLQKNPPELMETVQMDKDPSATLVAVQHSGEGIVVVDGARLYGVIFASTGTHKIVTHPLPGGNIVDIDRRLTEIDGQANDLFAVAGDDGVITFLGIKGDEVRNVRGVELGVPVEHIAFGKGTDLLVTSGTAVHRLTFAAGAQSEKLSIVSGSAPAAFAVQP